MTGTGEQPDDDDGIHTAAAASFRFFLILLLVFRERDFFLRRLHEIRVFSVILPAIFTLFHTQQIEREHCGHTDSDPRGTTSHRIDEPQTADFSAEFRVTD